MYLLIQASAVLITLSLSCVRTNPVCLYLFWPEKSPTYNINSGLSLGKMQVAYELIISLCITFIEIN